MISDDARIIDRDRIERQTEAFLARGGSVTPVRQGATGVSGSSTAAWTISVKQLSGDEAVEAAARARASRNGARNAKLSKKTASLRR